MRSVWRLGGYLYMLTCGKRICFLCLSEDEQTTAAVLSCDSQVRAQPPDSWHFEKHTGHLFAKSKETSCAPHIGRPLWLVARVLRSSLPWNNTYRAWLLKTPSTDNQGSHCVSWQLFGHHSTPPVFAACLMSLISQKTSFNPCMDDVFPTK